jgi:hypothetical protein
VEGMEVSTWDGPCTTCKEGKIQNSVASQAVANATVAFATVVSATVVSATVCLPLVRAPTNPLFCLASCTDIANVAALRYRARLLENGSALLTSAGC